MRYILLLFIIGLLSCNEEGSGEKKPARTGTTDSTKKSLPATASVQLRSTSFTINYYAPAVRGRVIWGGLVPYDEVWVTGAHSATKLTASGDFKMGDQDVPAGKYALFTIPGKDTWTVILNRNWEQHLADEYSKADDVLRLTVQPEVTHEVTERLKYEFKATSAETADVIISWEKIRIRFPIQVKP